MRVNERRSDPPWVPGVAVMIGLLVGFALPGSWHIVIRLAIVAGATAAAMITMRTVRRRGAAGS
jgi:hypothetical protein